MASLTATFPAPSVLNERILGRASGGPVGSSFSFRTVRVASGAGGIEADAPALADADGVAVAATVGLADARAGRARRRRRAARRHREAAPRRRGRRPARTATRQDDEHACGDDHHEQRRHHPDQSAQGLVAHRPILADHQPSQPRHADRGRPVTGPDAGRSWQADRSPGVSMPGADDRYTRVRHPSRRHTIEESPPGVQATRIRPDTRPTDLRRLAAAGLSALIPGLGQLYNRRRRLAALFLIPSLIVLVVGLLVVRTQSPTRLAAWVVAPQVLGTLLALDLLLMAWRLVAAGQAFLDTRRSGPTGPLAIVGIVLHRDLHRAPPPGRLPLRDGPRRHLRPDLRRRGPERGPPERHRDGRRRATASGSTCCSSARTSGATGRRT